MKYPVWLVVITALASACSFENKAELLTPTAPSGNAGGNTTSANTTANPRSASATPASAFAGTWGSSSIAGLPVGGCTDPKWLITEQSATAIAGTVSATCAGGATVAATLTGQTASNGTMNLAAAGTILAMGIPCPFTLTGIASPQPNDQMKLEYSGSHCLGPVSGTEMLRRFP